MTGYVGRVAERERLTELWGQAARVARCGWRCIAGEAGVGKTRLCNAPGDAHARARRIRALRALRRGSRRALPAVGAGDWAPRQRGAAEGPGSARGTPRRHPGAPRSGPRRSCARNCPHPAGATPRRSATCSTRLSAGLLEEAGRIEPLLVILDDLHWADAPTLSLLRHIVRADPSMRVLMVGTYRDSELSQEHPAHGAAGRPAPRAGG